MSTKSNSKLTATAGTGPAKTDEKLEVLVGKRKMVLKPVLPREMIHQGVHLDVSSPSEDLPETICSEANRLFQEAKAHMEQSGNIKTTIKQTVIENLGRMYELILKINEDRTLLRQKIHHLTQRVEGGMSKEMLEELKEQKALAIETMEEVRQMRREVGTLEKEIKGKTNTEGSTYAEKAASKSNPRTTWTPADPQIHSIVISSTDAKDSSEDVVKKVRAAVEAKTTGIRVDRVRKAKDQKVVIGCSRKEDLEKIKARINTGQPVLRVEQKENKDPLVIIKDVLNYNTDEDVLGSLKTQNSHILGHIPEAQYRASVRYRRRARNQLESHIVIQVSPSVWQALVEAGKIHIDLQRVVVQDQSPLIQCSRCLGFGHGKKLCTETEDRCSHCSGPHLRKDCPTRLAGGDPTCKNCTSAKLETIDHDTFSDCCPIKKKWDRLARSAIAYC